MQWVRCYLLRGRWEHWYYSSLHSYFSLALFKNIQSNNSKVHQLTHCIYEYSCITIYVIWYHDLICTVLYMIIIRYIITLKIMYSLWHIYTVRKNHSHNHSNLNLSIMNTWHDWESSPEYHTINTFIEDEVEELNKSILVFIEENVGNAGVHFF